jgi:hypothetical protein
MKKLILLLFIPFVSFSQSPIVYYDDDYSLFDKLMLTAFTLIFFYYVKKLIKKK